MRGQPTCGDYCLDLTAELNSGRFLKRLQSVQKALPKLTSRAMQLATTEARDAARKSAERSLERPRPQTLKSVRNNWPNKAQVRAGEAVGRVFVMPFLVEELHPLVFGGRETETPKGGGVVVSPTRDFRTNKFGNIPSLRRGIAFGRRRGQRAKFLEVPLDKKPPKMRHLPAGMYQIKGRGRRRRLVMIFSYRRVRQTKAVWSQYPRVTVEAFRQSFPTLFLKGLSRELLNKRR